MQQCRPLGDAMNRFEVTQTPSLSKWIFIGLFWAWGLAYGGHALSTLIKAENLSGLSAVTTGAVNMRLTAWIGGLLLFGIAAMAAPWKYTVLTEADAAEARRAVRRQAAE
jgi:hypothetical protein